MPGIDYRAARVLLPLADVLGLLGFRPCQRHGPQLRGPCQVHGSRSATSRSFAAHLGKNAWHCFRCGAGGNALDLGAAATQQPWHAAVRDLCQRLGRAVPWLPSPAAGLRTARRGETPMPEP
jgi:DNA primase